MIPHSEFPALPSCIEHMLSTWQLLLLLKAGETHKWALMTGNSTYRLPVEPYHSGKITPQSEVPSEPREVQSD